MIQSEKYVKALSAHQQIIIRAGFLASKEERMAKVVGLLDAVEELPRMSAEQVQAEDERGRGQPDLVHGRPELGGGDEEVIE